MAKILAIGFTTGRNVLNGREAIGESDKIMFWENTSFFVSKNKIQQVNCSEIERSWFRNEILSPGFSNLLFNTII